MTDTYCLHLTSAAQQDVTSGRDFVLKQSPLSDLGESLTFCQICGSGIPCFHLSAEFKLG